LLLRFIVAVAVMSHDLQTADGKRELGKLHPECSENT
jgi:hypothetical protein